MNIQQACEALKAKNQLNESLRNEISRLNACLTVERLSNATAALAMSGRLFKKLVSENKDLRKSLR